METESSSPDRAAPQPEGRGPVREIHHHYHSERRGFNFGRLFLGLIIVLIGLGFLARESGWLNIDFNFDWSLAWPILIIFIGLSMLSGRGWVSNIVGIVITVVVLGGIAFIIMGGNQMAFPTRVETVAVEKAAGTESVTVVIKNGAGSMRISGGATGLVSGRWESNFLTPIVESAVDGKTQNVTLRGEGNWRGWGRHFNNLDLHLSEEIPTRLEVNTGAVDLEADLSAVPIFALKLNTGASSVKLTLGDKATSTSLLLHAGVSSVSIVLPRSVGARLTLSSGLSSKNLSDFQQMGEKEYQSKDYDSAVKKIDMNLELGVSSLTIGWR